MNVDSTASIQTISSVDMSGISSAYAKLSSAEELRCNDRRC